MPNDLTEKLEEVYQEALKTDQFQGASLSEARAVFFEEVVRKVVTLDVRDPVRVALALHETLFTDQGSWETTHHITQVDLGILIRLAGKMFGVLCVGDTAEARAAFAAFESFQTGRAGEGPITHH